VTLMLFILVIIFYSCGSKSSHHKFNCT
jgi:hypothetical protein